MLSGCAVAPEMHAEIRPAIDGYRMACLPDHAGSGVIVISPFSLEDLYSGKRVIGSVFPIAPDRNGVTEPDRYYQGYFATESRARAHDGSSVTVRWDAQITAGPLEQLVSPISTSVSLANASISMPSAALLTDQRQICGLDQD
ncbi:MAG: hypothetical protein WDO24_14740 [Pseudomonadota bacterium]